jgi:ribose transport system ATP-binding protein
VSPFALELLGITKVYGATEVLHGVDFRVRPGSIHALLGANGAGKSTLLKIAVGAALPTSGRIVLNEQERHFSSPLEARKLGIGMVFQERSLIPDLSTVDNIFLNGEIGKGGLIQQGAQLREARRIFGRLGVHISPAARISQLSIADQQMVEIAKAVRLASAVLILDEPTAALTEREVQRLFAVVRQIARSGVGIVYVSHRLAEVFDLCDEATVIRDGRVVLSTSMAHTNLREVVEAIAGGPASCARGARIGCRRKAQRYFLRRSAGRDTRHCRIGRQRSLDTAQGPVWAGPAPQRQDLYRRAASGSDLAGKGH